MNPWQQFYCFFSIRVNKFSICFATMSTMLAFFLRGVSSLLAASDFWPWPEEQGSSSSLTSVVCVTSGSSFCSGLFTLWLPSPALLSTLPSEDSLAGCSELDSLPCSSALSSSVFFSFCSSALTRRFLDGVSKIILYKFYLIIILNKSLDVIQHSWTDYIYINHKFCIKSPPPICHCSSMKRQVPCSLSSSFRLCPWSELERLSEGGWDCDTTSCCFWWSRHTCRM